ncbi:MAG: PhoH family protein, partial [Bifidobacterium crudilactis]|nr:PhoH family protein [Bifidobacterium crudilactis]
RLGFDSKMVVDGDITQIDLSVPKSGLDTIESILHGIDDIAFAHLDASDVVRHELVGKIVQAYDRRAQRGLEREAKRQSAQGSPEKPSQAKDTAPADRES